MKFSIDNNFLIKIILYFLGFIILIYNLYLSDFNLPNYQGNYGFLNYSLEATEKDFFSSIIWEQTMVPLFRIYIFVFWKYFKLRIHEFIICNNKAIITFTSFIKNIRNVNIIDSFKSINKF